MNYPCKVIVAGHEVGVVSARTRQRFLVSIDWYGTILIIQASRYRGNPKSVRYTIPKQEKRATITVKM